MIIRFVSGLISQRQAVGLPAGLSVGAPDCRLDVRDCCQSGGAAGCCFPIPPATLWLTRYDALEGCDSMPLCVPIYYSADLDAWYSADFAPEMGGDLPRHFRLSCEAGAYRLDVVDGDGGDESLILAGSPADLIEPSCDPFLVAFDFFDDSPDVCPLPGGFSYFISESECVADGSGGGGDVSTVCCPGVSVPRSLLLNFTGSADPACNVSIPLEYDDLEQKWISPADAGFGTCVLDLGYYRLRCSPGGLWQLAPAGGEDWETAGSADCDPFELAWSDTAFLGTFGSCCAGGSAPTGVTVTG